NYVAEINLREEILASLQDKRSEVYKEQLYKTKFARSLVAQDLNEAALLLVEAISIFDSMEKQSAREKINLYSEYSVVLMWLNKTDKAWEMAHRAYDLALKKNTTTASYQKEIAGL